MSPATRLRLFYFAYYGSVGASLPYFAPYLRGLGFSGEEIGTVQMIGPLLAVPVALFWATLADRLGAPARALGFAAALCLASVLFLPFARVPLAVGLVLFAYGLGDRAIVPLVDSVTVEWAGPRPGTAYASIRLFGSLGYVALAQAVGLALTLRGDRPGDPLVPAAVVASVASYALLARRLPSPPALGERPRLREMLGLFSDGRLLFLLGVCALHWAACAPYHLMFGLRVRELGLPAGVTGLAMSVGVGAEVLALVAYPRFEARLSLKHAFALSFAASAVRWQLLSRATGAAEVVLLQTFHGFTFGLFWGAAVAATSRAVPSRLRATGQALFAAVVFGAGNAAGYQLSGVGYDRYRQVGPLYAWAALVELAAAAAVLLLPLGPWARYEERLPDGP
jgi:PPP family 3-phenylpropionic acid transporter